MRFNPYDKMYYTWLDIDDEDDNRELFYLVMVISSWLLKGRLEEVIHAFWRKKHGIKM